MEMGETWIRSLNNYQPLLSIGRYSPNIEPVGSIEGDYFTVYADGRTWIKSLDTNNQMVKIYDNTKDVFRIYGNGRTWLRSPNANAEMFTIYNGTNDIFKIYGDGRTRITSANANNQMFTINDGTKDKFRIYGDGRTFIGEKQVKSTHPHKDAILQVGGKIASMELILLDPLTKWADDVFDENYTLPTIKDVEKYIHTHKHLQGIPVSKEVEENGLNVNEIIPQLLRKIEEQMLYIIELNKKIEHLEKELKKNHKE